MGSISCTHHAPSLPPNTLPPPKHPSSTKHVYCNRWTKGIYIYIYIYIYGVHNTTIKYNTIPNESLGSQHSRDGCQSLPQNADILQVRHTLPTAQCFYNALFHSPGSCCGGHPNAEAMAAVHVLPLFEAGLPQCLSNHQDKVRSHQGFPTLEQKLWSWLTSPQAGTTYVQSYTFLERVSLRLLDVDLEPSRIFEVIEHNIPRVADPVLHWGATRAHTSGSWSVS